MFFFLVDDKIKDSAKIRYTSSPTSCLHLASSLTYFEVFRTLFQSSGTAPAALVRYAHRRVRDGEVRTTKLPEPILLSTAGLPSHFSSLDTRALKFFAFSRRPHRDEWLPAGRHK